MPTTEKTAIRSARRRDRLARWIITLGGVTIIASVVAILVLIVGVTWPLFRPARAEVKAERIPLTSSAIGKVIALGVELDTDEHEKVKSLTGHFWSENGTCTFVAFPIAEKPTLAEAAVGHLSKVDHPPDATIEVLGQEKVAPAGARSGNRIVTIERHGEGSYSLLWSDGSVSLVEVKSVAEFDAQGQRQIKYRLISRADASAEAGLRPVFAMMRGLADSNGAAAGFVCVRQLADNRISVARELTVESLLGEQEKKVSRLIIAERIPGRITAMTMTLDGRTLYAGTANGILIHWDFDDDGQITDHEVVPAFRDRRSITALAMVLGDVSLAVGDTEGGVSTWFPLSQDRPTKLRLIHDLSAPRGPVREILPSGRNKALLSLDSEGRAYLDYMTSERHLMNLAAADPLRLIGYSPRGNAAIALDDDNRVTVWQIDNLHPEVSAKVLFGKVLYEGYREADFVWQTTGGAEFEPKLSLVPLLFGTLKGTAYAMVFAVPLALFGAVYTSHFTTPAFKRVIKPAVEIMAAVPSVVVGFLAALWLAPVIERWILALFAGALTVPLAFVLFMLIWQLLRRWDWAKRVEHGYEFLVLVPVIVIGVVLAGWLARPLEESLFDGNFKLWLSEALQMRYDQRNCVVIAFGLGFAVIPIIFSISDDSLSSVPHNLTAASMAMGASRWQTVWRVVLPSASPGIFAAMMIGFGRAVGETMIVLMATGNTPILDWSPFNGMRTLSANIAVEIPEAPVGGTLYRVLFLCAVLLFLLTFALNTAAELVRTRLRQRYGRF